MICDNQGVQIVKAMTRMWHLYQIALSTYLLYPYD